MSAKLRVSDRCHICGYKHDLRRDGTLGKHHVWIGHQYQGVCAGTGMTVGETYRRVFGGEAC